MRITFDVVRLAMQVGYKCKGCGKPRTKAVRVEHTVNPFNRNADGIPKSREEVYRDVKQVFNERCIAVKAGVLCSKCEATNDK